MTDFKLIGEEDFFSELNEKIEPFIAEKVNNGSFESFDKTILNYYYAVPDKARATVVMVHGMSEFFGKYHEYVWNLYNRGYAVFFCEQRGHGYSGGKLQNENSDIIHIDNYNTYVEDLNEFVTRIVLPSKEMKPPLLLFAHSMGGAVAALYLEKYPKIIKAALLSSPMMRMKAGNYSLPMLWALSIYGVVTGKNKQPAPGQKHFDKDVKMETGSAQSRARFEYQLRQRKEDKHYQTTGGSLGWAVASMKAAKQLLRKAGKISVPVNIMIAGDDHLIDPAGYDEFIKRVPLAGVHRFELSRHEIFNSDDRSRFDYYKKVFEILDDYANLK